MYLFYSCQLSHCFFSGESEDVGLCETSTQYRYHVFTVHLSSSVKSFAGFLLWVFILKMTAAVPEIGLLHVM